jgi:putative NADPH-quinone reductase
MDVRRDATFQPTESQLKYAQLTFWAGIDGASGGFSVPQDLFAQLMTPQFGKRQRQEQPRQTLRVLQAGIGHLEAARFIVAETFFGIHAHAVFWLHFPAILKGWFERVFAYGDAYALTLEGWHGEAKGRVPLLHHEKALVISTTLFKEEDYKADWEAPMTRIIDDWGLRYPGVKNVEHVYFYNVPTTDDATRRGYLERAYTLGKEFAPSD